MTLLTYLANLISVFGLVAPLLPVTSVPTGQPYDIALTSSIDVVYPIRDVDLIGVFTGPSGQTLVLPGFWDGGRSFHTLDPYYAVAGWRRPVLASCDEAVSSR